MPDPTRPDDAALALQSVAQLVAASRRATLGAALLVLAYVPVSRPPAPHHTVILDAAYDESPAYRDGADLVDKAVTLVVDAIMRTGYFKPDDN